MTRPDPQPLLLQRELLAPYSLRQTMAVLARGHADPALQFTQTGLWWAIRTPEGAPVTIRVQQREDVATGGTLRAQLYGPGAERVAPHLWRMLGVDDDWADFDDQDFLDSLPSFIRVARRSHTGLKLPATGLLFDQLTTVVLEQKVTHEEARFAWRTLLRRFGETPPGPAPERLRVPPSPQQWARIPSWAWHQARVDGHRSRTIVALAHRASALARLSAQPLPELRRSLLKIPGVGAWTIAEVLQRTHADPDTVSVGDYHLAHHVCEALSGRRGDDARMLELLRPWHGQRHRVVRMIGVSGLRPSRFGPKLSPEDHRGR